MANNKYSYPLAHTCLSKPPSIVDAVSAILLLLFSLFLFSTLKQQPGTVLPPCRASDYCRNNSLHMCDLHVNSEVYFGLNMQCILSDDTGGAESGLVNFVEAQHSEEN